MSGLQDLLSERAVHELAIFGPIEAIQSRSVQLHSVGGFHWVAMSWDGCSLKFYISLYNKAQLEYVIYDISTLHINFAFSDVEVKSVPQQNGSTGCGCYGLFFSVCFVLGVRISRVSLSTTDIGSYCSVSYRNA